MTQWLAGKAVSTEDALLSEILEAFSQACVQLQAAMVAKYTSFRQNRLENMLANEPISLSAKLQKALDDGFLNTENIESVPLAHMDAAKQAVAGWFSEDADDSGLKGYSRPDFEAKLQKGLSDIIDRY
jgi:hypothetical protein